MTIVQAFVRDHLTLGAAGDRYHPLADHGFERAIRKGMDSPSLAIAPQRYRMLPGNSFRGAELVRGASYALERWSRLP